MLSYRSLNKKLSSAPSTLTWDTFKQNFLATTKIFTTIMNSMSSQIKHCEKLLNSRSFNAEELFSDIDSEKIRKMLTKYKALSEKYKDKDKSEVTPEFLKEFEKDQMLINSFQAKLSLGKKSLLHSKITTRYVERQLNSIKVQLDSIALMAFVYIVTIWDAFVLDTVRQILSSHPQLISTSDELVKISKSELWNLKSGSEIRDLLIESEVRNLDADRKLLLVYFKEYWGVDWSKSNVPLKDIIEIRARRDICVHNKGIVNNQYLKMTGNFSNYKLHELATVDQIYLKHAMDILVDISIYIQKIAFEKHFKH